MKIADIRNHLSKLLNNRLSLPVFVEDIGELKQDSLFIDLIDVRRTMLGDNRERFRCNWNVKYIPHGTGSQNVKLMDGLDGINRSFDMLGKKVLKVYDRFITLQTINQRIVENIGHYTFETDIIVPYGSEWHYELMQELELTYKEN